MNTPHLIQKNIQLSLLCLDDGSSRKYQKILDFIALLNLNYCNPNNLNIILNYELYTIRKGNIYATPSVNRACDQQYIMLLIDATLPSLHLHTLSIDPSYPKHLPTPYCYIKCDNNIKTNLKIKFNHQQLSFPYLNTYCDDDSLRYFILTTLGDELDMDAFNIYEDQLLFHDIAIAQFGQLPFALNNPSLTKLLKKRFAAIEKLDTAREAYFNDDTNASYKKLHQTNRLYQQASSHCETYQYKLLNLSLHLSLLAHELQHPLLAQCYNLFIQGKIVKADRLLNIEQIQTELQQALQQPGNTNQLHFQLLQLLLKIDLSLFIAHDNILEIIIKAYASIKTIAKHLKFDLHYPIVKVIFETAHNFQSFFRDQQFYLHDIIQNIYSTILQLCQTNLKRDYQHFSNLMASAYNDIATQQIALSNYDGAEQSYKSALLAIQKIQKNAPVNTSYRLANQLQNLADFYSKMNNPQQAQTYYVKALNIYQKTPAPLSNEYQIAMAILLRKLGDTYNRLNNYPEAEQAYQQSLQAYLSSIPPISTQNDVLNHAKIQNILGNFYAQHGYYDEAENALSTAFEIYIRLANSNPELFDADYAKLLYDNGLIYLTKQHYESAIDEFKNALKLIQKLAKVYPNNYILPQADLLRYIGECHQELHNNPAAEQSYRAEIQLLSKMEKKSPLEYATPTASALMNIAQYYWDIQKYTKSKSSIQRAIIYYEQDAASNQLAIATAWMRLGIVEWYVHNYYSADTYYQKSLEIFNTLSNGNPELYLDDRSICLYNRALLYMDTHQYTQALTYAQQALRLYEQCPNPDIQSQSKIMKLIQHIQHVLQ